MASDAEHLQMLRSTADQLEATAAAMKITTEKLSLAVSRLTSRTKKMRPAAGPPAESPGDGRGSGSGHAF